MKKVTIITAIAFLACVFQMNAQERIMDGKLSTTTTKTMNWVKDGVKIPYKVTVQENRIYSDELVEIQNSNTNYNAKQESAMVSKMINVSSEYDKALNRVLIVRYEKQVTDSFKIKSTEKGFVIEVDGKICEFNMGNSTFYTNTTDNDFFIVEEYNMM